MQAPVGEPSEGAKTRVVVKPFSTRELIARVRAQLLLARLAAAS
ncbi:hypothetical protein WMF38_29680 [Sorangium sp. So ce118]